MRRQSLLGIGINTRQQGLANLRQPYNSSATAKAIARELASGGVAALYGWLLDVELGEFNQRTRPPETEARQRLVELSRTAWQTFFYLWRAGELGHGLWGCCLTSDVYAMFLEWCRV